MIDRAKEAGAVRPDVDGSDVMQLVSPVCTNASVEPEQAGRLLRMVLDGLRADAARPSSPDGSRRIRSTGGSRMTGWVIGRRRR